MPAKKATTTTKRAARRLGRRAAARRRGRLATPGRRAAAPASRFAAPRDRATRSTKGSAKRGTRKATSTTRAKAARKTAPARGRRTTSRSPDGLALLKSDHATVKDLFRRYKGLGDRALKSKTQTMKRIVTELSVHASVEEQVFYPDVKRRVPGSKRLVDHGLDEHQELKETLVRLQRMSPDTPEFDAAMRKVIADVTDHVKEEESELFPKVRKAMSKQELTDMAGLMRTAKRAAPTRPHPLASVDAAGQRHRGRRCGRGRHGPRRGPIARSLPASSSADIHLVGWPRRPERNWRPWSGRPCRCRIPAACSPVPPSNSWPGLVADASLAGRPAHCLTLRFERGPSLSRCRIPARSSEPGRTRDDEFGNSHRSNDEENAEGGRRDD